MNVYEFCDNIDAAVFSGDAMEDPETLLQFAEFVGRWQRYLKERESTEAERVRAYWEAQNDPVPVDAPIYRIHDAFVCRHEMTVWTLMLEELKKWEKCSHCNGDGWIEIMDMVEEDGMITPQPIAESCEKCDGTGRATP